MAEERRAWVHSGEALAKMGKQGHARHGVRRKVQKVEAVGVHDVVEEVGERGAEPAGEVIDQERISTCPGLGKASRDDFCGRMPRHLSPQQGLEFLPEGASAVETKRVCFFRTFTSSLSDTSFPSTALAAPLPLLALGAMAAEKG